MKSLSPALLLAVVLALTTGTYDALALPHGPSGDAGRMHTVTLERRASANSAGVADFDAIGKHLAFLEAKYAAQLGNSESGARNPSTLNSKDGSGAAKACAAGGGGGAVFTAALTPAQGDSSWATPASFGSSASFPMILDTASSDCRVARSAYDPTKSSTAVNTGTPFNFPYTNGRPTSGTVWRDTLHIGGASIPSVAVGVSDAAFLSSAGGVCGLAPDGSSAFNNNFHPFFYQMVSSGAVAQPVFAFALSASGGSVTLGGTAASQFTGGISQVAAVDPKNGYWKLTGRVAGVRNDFILDSSSELMVVPPSDVGTYFANLGATQFSQNGVLYGSYPCSTPPSLVFQFGSTKVPVIASAKSIGTTADGKCILPIVGKSLGLAVPMVGGPLFYSAMISFDVKANTVGFAKRV